MLVHNKNKSYSITYAQTLHIRARSLIIIQLGIYNHSRSTHQVSCVPKELLLRPKELLLGPKELLLGPKGLWSEVDFLHT